MYLPLLSCKRCRLRRQHSTSGALMRALVISLGVPIDALELGTATQHSGQPVRPGKNGHLSCRVEPSTPPLLHCRRLLPYRPLASVAPQICCCSHQLLYTVEAARSCSVASASPSGSVSRYWRHSCQVVAQVPHAGHSCTQPSQSCAQSLGRLEAAEPTGGPLAGSALACFLQAAVAHSCTCTRHGCNASSNWARIHVYVKFASPLISFRVKVVSPLGRAMSTSALHGQVRKIVAGRKLAGS